MRSDERQHPEAQGAGVLRGVLSCSPPLAAHGPSEGSEALVWYFQGTSAQGQSPRSRQDAASAAQTYASED